MRRTLYLDHQVVGFIDFDQTEDAYYLHWTEVYPEYRTNGYSTKVVSTLVEEARAKNQRVYLDFVDSPRGTSPYYTTESARAFYGRVGFTEIFRYDNGNVTRMGSTLPSDRGPVAVLPEAYLFLLTDTGGEGEAHAGVAGAGLQD